MQKQFAGAKGEFSCRSRVLIPSIWLYNCSTQTNRNRKKDVQENEGTSLRPPRRNPLSTSHSFIKEKKIVCASSQILIVRETTQNSSEGNQFTPVSSQSFFGLKDRSKDDGAIRAVSAGSKLKQPERRFFFCGGGGGS